MSQQLSASEMFAQPVSGDALLPDASPRPGEVVREYIRKECLSGSRAGHRLPTIEWIAGHLDVSISTVRNVVRRLTDEGVLETVQGKGTFVASQAEPRRREGALVVGSNMAMFNIGHALNWSESIYFGAVRAVSQLPQSVSMLPVTNKEGSDFESVLEHLLAKIDDIDMLMLYPVRATNAERKQAVFDAYERAGKPVVWINPPQLNCVENFVSGDYFGITRHVGRCLREAGRRRILYVGVAGLYNSTSEQLYLNGLASGAGRDEGGDVAFTVRFAREISEPAGEALMEELLAHSDCPDAIFCSSDTVCLGVLRVLRRHEIKIPEQVSVITGTGLSETRLRHPEITFVDQPMAQIGETALELLYRRYQTQNAPVTGVYLPCGIACRETTTERENALLKGQVT